ncbi:TetR/AcrR family transcriptional regulator [Actinophytocola sp.]|uniref:TetR/AcrR family transcriptional regulator n=1 Tax=Actinophytocola sp. TaxID=1872138 RepID=UPI00389A5284
MDDDATAFTATRPVQTRRRGAELEQAILDATWDELREVGYTALTIEAVAKRAGTSKPVIYRRWPRRAELVMAAWGRQQPVESQVPELGSLRADVLWLFTRIAKRMSAMMSQTIAGVMADAFKHPEIKNLLREKMDNAPMASRMWKVVDDAIARGELKPVYLPPRVLRLPLDLIRSEAMVYGGPLPDEALESMVDDVYIPLLKGLAAD